MNIEIIKGSRKWVREVGGGEGGGGIVWHETKNEYHEGHLKARRETGGPVTVTKINVRIRSSSYNGLV